MDPREHLQSVLTGLINSDEDAAKQAIHQYLVHHGQRQTQAPQTSNEFDDIDD